MDLPASALLSSWYPAVRTGTASVDQLAARVLGEAPHSLVVDLDGSTLPLAAAVPQWAAEGLGVTVALPAPGDPTGLGGPADFNRAALEAGEAVVLVSPEGWAIGLVPEEDARTLVWRSLPAGTPPYLDAAEAARDLRAALTRSTTRLAELDVASWQPEIPDLLLNLRHRAAPPVPRAWGPRRLETLDRALLCRDIVTLALVDDGGAVSAHEMQLRREALRDLDRAARRAMVAVCSDSLVSP